jgi:carboxyl-terminal processing protease
MGTGSLTDAVAMPDHQTSSVEQPKRGQIACWACIAGLSLLLAGCAGPGEHTAAVPQPSGFVPAIESDEPFNDDSVDVFEEALVALEDRYIDAVDLTSLTVDGLNGLAVIDPSVSAVEKGTHIFVSYDGRLIYDMEIPSDDVAEGMSEQVYDAIRAIRAVSPVVQNDRSAAIQEAFFDGLISSLDTYTRYDGPERAEENRAQRQGYGGIGIRIKPQVDSIQVASVMDDTPAQQAGLKDNDEITHVDGKPVVNWDTAQAVRILRGPVGSNVVLTVRRAGANGQFDVVITRKLVIPTTVTYERLGDIGVIRISRFNTGTLTTLNEKLETIMNGPDRITGLVLDLRDNPGGLLDSSIDVADSFLTDGLILVTHGRHYKSYQRYYASAGDNAKGIPIVVLINDHSASAAEILGAALQDNGRAVVLGTNSFGKGSVQTVITLPTGAELTMTWARFFAPSGYVLHGLGILPTVCTSHHGKSPSSFLQAIKTTNPSTPSALADWRSSVTISDSRRPELRKICPADDEKDDTDFDLQVAKLLLKNKPLFEQELLGSSSQIASERPSARTYN